jgi:hypothetical protein
MLADPLRVALCLGGAFELLLPASGDGDDVSAAIVCGVSRERQGQESRRP